MSAAVMAPDPLAAAPSRAELARRARLPLLVVAALLVVAVAWGAPADAAMTVVHRLGAADPAWVLAAVGLEACSFLGYVLLLWHVAGRATPRFGLLAAYRTTVAGAAATRLLPTAGAGGAALTLWVLRRAGLGGAAAARALLGFLVVLYAVFLLAVCGAGLLVSVEGRPAVGAAPAALAALAMATAVLLARRAGAASQHATPPTPPSEPVRAAGAMRTGIGGVGERLRAGMHRLPAAASTLGLAVRDAAGIVRAGDPRLLGAVAWWGFDVAVLGAAVHAVGGSVALGTLVLAYFLGQVANTVPVPGAASSGLVGVLIALGLAPAVAVAAVLVYRAVAVWLPAPAGATALAGLRRTVAGWRADDAGAGPAPCAPCHAPQPLAA